MSSFADAPDGDSGKGAKIFKTKCAQCHVVSNVSSCPTLLTFSKPKRCKALQYLRHIDAEMPCRPKKAEVISKAQTWVDCLEDR